MSLSRTKPNSSRAINSVSSAINSHLAQLIQNRQINLSIYLKSQQLALPTADGRKKEQKGKSPDIRNSTIC